MTKDEIYEIVLKEQFGDHEKNPIFCSGLPIVNEEEYLEKKSKRIEGLLRKAFRTGENNGAVYKKDAIWIAYNHGFNDGYKTGSETASDIDAKPLIEKSYNSGMKVAWEAARRIVLPSDCYDKHIDVGKVFGLKPWVAMRTVLKEYTAQEVVEQIAKYDKMVEKAVDSNDENEIRVGDEVISCGHKAVVTAVKGGQIGILYDDGFDGIVGHEILKKTGRHFDDVKKILDMLNQKGEKE